MWHSGTRLSRAQLGPGMTSPRSSREMRKHVVPTCAAIWTPRIPGLGAVGGEVRVAPACGGSRPRRRHVDLSS